MNIYFYDVNDDEGSDIFNLTLDCQPYKVGEKIQVSIQNHNPQHWDVKEMVKIFKVMRIEHQARKSCTGTGVAQINESSDTIIYLKEIENLKS